MAEWFRWEQPRIHDTDAAEGAKATSADLFYDLVFAVVVAQLATALGERLSWPALLTFVVLFVPAARVWVGQTLYGDRFEAEDVSYRLFTFLGMLAAAGLAVAAPTGLAEGFPLFAGSYVFARVLQEVGWIRAARTLPFAAGLARRYAVFYGLEAALWLAAVPAPPAARFALVLLAVIADLVLPLFTTGIQAQLGDFRQEHLSDRFGAFFLLILGQLVLVAVLIMTRMRVPSPADLVAGALAFATAFVLWWIYVDHVVGRPLRQGAPWHAVWIYLHLPLFIAAGAFGAAVFSFVTRGEAVVPEPVRLVLAGSFALALLFAGLAELALVPLLEYPGRVFRTTIIHVVPALGALLVGVLGGGLAAIPLMLLLLADGLVALALGEIYRARA